MFCSNMEELYIMEVMEQTMADGQARAVSHGLLHYLHLLCRMQTSLSRLP